MGRLNTHIIIFALAFLSLNNIGFAQTNSFDIIPKEEVFATTNTNILVAGESLYYKVYCLDKETKDLSTISKVGYALLVNDAKKVVFEHKLLLKNGLASGDYYIPSSVKTGHYKLISYTKWMNNNEMSFFSKDLYIVNPFSTRGNKNSTVSSNEKSIDSLMLSKSINKATGFTDNNLELSISEDVLNTRSKASLGLKGLSNLSGLGNYSISIRKADLVEIVSSGFSDKSKDATKKEHEFQLPEMRGEIISGKVVTADGSAPVPDKIVGLSISGNATIFKNVKTNSSGKFYFSLYENYKPGQIVVQVIDPEYKIYKIVLDEFSFNYFDELSFNQLDLHQNIKTWLLEKSVNNQIESAYFDTKKDSVISYKKANYFYGGSGKNFVLDDYTRFSTVKETLIEVIHGAGVRTIDGKRKIIVYAPETTLDRQLGNLDDLVLIDGIPLYDHEILLDLNPKDIESINVINKVYFYGPNIYNGILSVKTKKEKFSLPYNALTAEREIQSPLNKKVFYSQNYDLEKSKFDRIPDNRTQLVWIPEFQMKNNLEEIHFYTSDVLGTYEILVEGYTNKGEHLKLKKYFEVK